MHVTLKERKTAHACISLHSCSFIHSYILHPYPPAFDASLQFCNFVIPPSPPFPPPFSFLFSSRQTLSQWSLPRQSRMWPRHWTGPTTLTTRLISGRLSSRTTTTFLSLPLPQRPLHLHPAPTGEPRPPRKHAATESQRDTPLGSRMDPTARWTGAPTTDQRCSR